MINPGFTKSIDIRFQKRITNLVFKYFFQTYIVPPPTRIKKLLALLDTDDSNKLCDAAFGVGNSGSRSAIVQLAKLYYAHCWKNETQLNFLYPHSIRAALAIALFNLGEPKELNDVLFSESGFMRPWMVTALKELDSNQVVNCLTSALKSQDDSLVYWAVRALGECGDERVINSLINTLKHPYIDARVAAADSLGKIGDNSALQALEFMKATDQELDWLKRKASKVAEDAIIQIKEKAA